MRSIIKDNQQTIERENANVDSGLVKLAMESAGNWRDFPSFAWSRAYNDSIDQPDLWMIVYTVNRDSTLLDQSNASQIDKALSVFDETLVIPERHSHWACGWIDGYAIRVFFPGTWHITTPFVAYAELQQKMENYPVLDDEDYSNREYDATIENIGSIIRFDIDTDLQITLDDKSESWLAHKVYRWISDIDSNALENTDDRGGYPDKDLVAQVLIDHGFAYPENYDPPDKPDPDPEDDCKHWDSIIESQTPRQGILWEAIPVSGHPIDDMLPEDDSEDVNPLVGDHWIAQSGMHGYLPESSYVYDSEDSAIESLADDLELSDSAIADLRQYGIVDIDESNSNIGVSVEHSIWYVSVEHCDCDDPDQHDDSF